MEPRMKFYRGDGQFFATRTAKCLRTAKEEWELLTGLTSTLQNEAEYQGALTRDIRVKACCNIDGKWRFFGWDNNVPYELLVIQTSKGSWGVDVRNGKIDFGGPGWYDLATFRRLRRPLFYIDIGEGWSCKSSDVMEIVDAARSGELELLVPTDVAK